MLTIAGGIILAFLILALVPLIFGGSSALLTYMLATPIRLAVLGLGVLYVGVSLLIFADRGPLRFLVALGLGFCLYKLWRALERTRGS